MKRAAAASVMISGLLLGRFAPADADEYADFRIPAHRQTSWNASLATGGNRSSREGDSEGPSFTHRDGRGSNLSGSAGTSWSWLSDSDPLVAALSASTSFSGAGSWDASRTLYSQPLQQLWFEEARENRVVSEAWSLAATWRWYPWRMPLGFSVSSVGSGSYRQLWARADSWTYMRSPFDTRATARRWRNSSWYYQYQASTFLSVGLGRVRDATGLFETQILENRLLETGALARPLSPAARQKLAQLVYLRGSLYSIRTRPGRSLWQAVEEILIEDGAVSERGLDAYSILRAGERLYAGIGSGVEGLPSSPISRLRGWFVGPLVVDYHLLTLDRGHRSEFSQDALNDTLQAPQAFEFGFRDRRAFDDVSLGARAEAHWPLGMRWQVDLSTQAASPLRAEREGFDYSTQGSATWLVADRWLASMGISHGRSVRKIWQGDLEVTTLDAWGWALGASAIYFLEDRVYLTAGGAVRQDHYNFFGGEDASRYLSLSLGLSYRLIGRYHAPGLLGPMDVMADR